MYKLINNQTGAEIGITESLRYIKRNPRSGALIEATPETAEGVAFEGVWNIFPHEKLTGDDVSGMATISELNVTEHFARISRSRANMDYVAMMADIDLPIEDEEAPGQDPESTHSLNFFKFKQYYDRGDWNSEMIQNAVTKGKLTSDEAAEIDVKN